MNILVCVTKKETARHLIEKGVEMKSGHGGELFILHVTKKEIQHCSSEIDYFYNVCKAYDAGFGVIHSDSIIKSIVRYVKERDIDKIVLGMTRRPDLKESTMFRLQKALHGLAEIVIVPIQEGCNLKDVI